MYEGWMVYVLYERSIDRGECKLVDTPYARADWVFCGVIGGLTILAAVRCWWYGWGHRAGKRWHRTMVAAGMVFWGGVVTAIEKEIGAYPRDDEADWNFGQVLAVAMLLGPLYDAGTALAEVIEKWSSKKGRFCVSGK